MTYRGLVRLDSILPDRLRRIGPEALAFAVIGALNTLLTFAISNVLKSVGDVKATVIATVITTTLSYLANRHWTYKDRPRSALRREYTLFFGFNLAGMIIQAGVVGFSTYALGMRHNRLAFNIALCVGIGLATVFRFWAYRTMVFKSEPALAVIDIPAERTSPEDVEFAEFTQLTADLEAEFSANEPAVAKPLAG